jgi:hypothetical protein
VMTDEVVAAAARAAARELAPQYGARVEADVEAALYSAGKSEPPPQFFDPIALGGLIVAIATLAYQVYSDRKKDGHKPSKDTVARAVRVERRKYSDLTAAEEKIIEIVSAEIITFGDDELGPAIYNITDDEPAPMRRRRRSSAGSRGTRPGGKGSVRSRREGRPWTSG